MKPKLSEIRAWVAPQGWSDAEAAALAIKRISRQGTDDKAVWLQIVQEVVDNPVRQEEGELVTALEQLRRDAARYRTIEQRRVELIQTARHAGHTWATIAEAAGMAPFACRRAIARTQTRTAAVSEVMEAPAPEPEVPQTPEADQLPDHERGAHLTTQPGKPATKPTRSKASTPATKSSRTRRTRTDKAHQEGSESLR